MPIVLDSIWAPQRLECPHEELGGWIRLILDVEELATNFFTIVRECARQAAMTLNRRGGIGE